MPRAVLHHGDHENDVVDAAMLIDWVRQASRLPDEVL